MALAQEDIAVIQELITKSLSESLKSDLVNVHYELEIRERILRVEEGLKHQRELMQEGFKRMDQRFEQMEKRFEQVDKRFELLIAEMNARFEQVDKRLEQVDKRFESLTRRIDRFMIWSFATTLTVGGLVVAAIRFLP